MRLGAARRTEARMRLIRLVHTRATLSLMLMTLSLPDLLRFASTFTAEAADSDADGGQTSATAVTITVFGRVDEGRYYRCLCPFPTAIELLHIRKLLRIVRQIESYHFQISGHSWYKQISRGMAQGHRLLIRRNAYFISLC